MAFTRSPYRLTRTTSLRVEEDFSERLAAASLKAGVPNGVLLARLLDQYLGDSTAEVQKPLTVRDLYVRLGESLGFTGTPSGRKLGKGEREAKGKLAEAQRDYERALAKPRDVFSEGGMVDPPPEPIATIPVPAEPFTWEPQVHSTPVKPDADLIERVSPLDFWS